MGEMSFISPRPEQVAFAKQYEKSLNGYALRHQIRPGITGLAQLRVGNTNDIRGTELKLIKDRVYLENASLKLDAKYFV